MEEQIERLEQLLNFASALRPDLADSELYELIVGGLSELSGYPAALLWLVEGRGELVRPVAWSGLPREQTQAFAGGQQRSCALDQLRHAGHPIGEGCWWSVGAPLEPLPEPVKTAGWPGGHVLLLPLVYTETLGVAMLATPEQAPEPERIAFAQRCVDQISVALAAAQIFTENMRARDELRRLAEVQELLLATIAELSTPVLPLSEGVLLLPIVGGLDSRRMAMMSETLLKEVASRRARVVLVDITGLSVVDTRVAAELIGLARSIRLLGGRVVLVGVRPETAQTIVGLGLDLAEITTRASLADGLRIALGAGK